MRHLHFSVLVVLLLSCGRGTVLLGELSEDGSTATETDSEPGTGTNTGTDSGTGTNTDTATSPGTDTGTGTVTDIHTDTDTHTHTGDPATDSEGETDSETITDSDSDTACPLPSLVGWASIEAEGVPTTTGGGVLSPVRPSSVEELRTLASENTAQVIEIADRFELDQTPLSVSSNKTLKGVGTSGTIVGVVDIRGVENVIVQNLTLVGLVVPEEPRDVVAVFASHHVWIDHCDIMDGTDGNLDITRGSNWITVSWTRFSYSADNIGGNKSSLVGGGSDHEESDANKMNTTWHHNWFTERINAGMPRFLFGKSHAFNSYFSARNNEYCIGAGSYAQVLVENCYFDGSTEPMRFADSNPASITERNNIFHNTVGKIATGGEMDPFTDFPYAYELDNAEDVPDLVQRCAGPQPEQ